MFALSNAPLDAEAHTRRMARPEAGACVTFEGWVRNHHEGRAVTLLEYEAYDAVAVAEGAKILAEARGRFDLIDVQCVHRVGSLAIGDLAVWTGVCAAHRDEAFRACRYIIDEIKSRVPIWKKEHYAEGDSGWVNSEQVGDDKPARRSQPLPSFSEADYYARQTRLPDVGKAGQAKLRASKALIVGSGGLGSPALSYLAAAGVGTLGICEGDTLEASNLHRQTLYHYADVGESKGPLAEKRLREQNPFIDVRLHTDGLTPENVLETLAPYDLILDCTDNFATKFLLNDAAVLTGKPVIFASIYQYDGQLVFVRPGSGGPCLRCLWPEIPEPGCVGSCAEVGVLGAVPGIFGAMQAVEAMKFILGLPDLLGDEMVIFNCLTYASQRVKMPRHPACPVCGTAPRIRAIVRDEYLPPADISVDVSALQPEQLKRYRIIDIREADEVASQPLEGVDHEHIAMSAWDTDHLPIGADEPCLLCCARGMRSQTLAERLREVGCTNVYSVQNGWEAFHQLARK
jgi:adenylyltransferase/sulfurtransferase